MRISNATLYHKITPVKSYLLQMYESTNQITVKIKEHDNLKSMFENSANLADVSKRMETIKNDIANLLELRAEIEKQVDESTNDMRFKQILLLRYRDGYSMEEVAKILAYGKRWIERLNKKALKEFEQYLVDNNVKYQLF